VHRENKDDFRAGASSGGIMKPCKLSAVEEKIAVRAAAAVGATFAGVDILFDALRLPLVCEVNSNAHFVNFFNVTKIDFSEKIAQKINKISYDL
jgi:glutathione synthase/RimK-type ligase-like ATP-grasp enzyme